MTATATLRRTHESAVEHPSTCSCGQSLDACHAEHCPRCGCAVHHRTWHW